MSNDTQKGCCPRCGRKSDVVDMTQCPFCHTQKESWREELRKIADANIAGDGGAVATKYIHRIEELFARTLAAERKALVEEIKQSKAIEQVWFAGNDVEARYKLFLRLLDLHLLPTSSEEATESPGGRNKRWGEKV